MGSGLRICAETRGAKLSYRDFGLKTKKWRPGPDSESGRLAQPIGTVSNDDVQGTKMVGLQGKADQGFEERV
jgi:hypothetical protein